MSRNNLPLKALAAQAIGDAIGWPFEFQRNPSRSAIAEYFDSGGPLEITDDTQMAMFGMEAITKAYASHNRTPTYVEVYEAAILSYHQWFLTQTYNGPGPNANTGGLVSEPLMYARRAPGNTCLSSLQERSRGKPVKNDSNGCGTVMRLLPFILLGQYEPLMAIKVAQATSIYTHQGDEIQQATDDMFTMAAHMMLPGRQDPMPGGHIGWYGEGWTADSCVRMASWAVTNATSFRDAILNATCHGGDSDSVGAVAGALWGLTGDPSAIMMLDRVKERDLIRRVAVEFSSTLENHYEYQRRQVPSAV
jgi:ADP-ribosylglycohydrolase